MGVRVCESEGMGEGYDEEKKISLYRGQIWYLEKKTNMRFRKTFILWNIEYRVK